MGFLAVELVDSGVITVDPRGRVSTPSPGLAVVDRDRLTVGLEAAAIARHSPRRLHSRFWQDLGTEPLGKPFPSHLRAADLAHAHLWQVWQTSGAHWSEALIAVPGTMTRPQLGLLLGVSEACGMEVRGLVDLAVAAAAGRAIRTRCLHLDLHLHRAVLTVLRADIELRREMVVEEARIGLAGLLDSWARSVAAKFVGTTRFDPLLTAVTEQELYERLPAHLRSLCDLDTVEIELSSGERHHAVELERREVMAAAAGYGVLRELVAARVDSGGATLLLSDRAASLPGLADVLDTIAGLEIARLQPAAAASAALDNARLVIGDGPTLRLATSLPRSDDTPRGAQTVAVDG